MSLFKMQVKFHNDLIGQNIYVNLFDKGFTKMKERDIIKKMEKDRKKDKRIQ